MGHRMLRNAGGTWVASGDVITNINYSGSSLIYFKPIEGLSTREAVNL